MKSQSKIESLARLPGGPFGLNRSAALGLTVLAIAAAVLALAPARSNAREFAHDMHMHATHAVGHAAVAHAVRTDWHGGVGFHGAAPGFHGGYPGWHGGGRWEHGWHGGVYGWWMVDAGIWTAYPYYAYGYPYGYYPPYAYPAYGYAPPDVGAANLPAQQQTWYFCDAARAYYPNVQNCPSGWRPVAAAPVAPPAPAAPR